MPLSIPRSLLTYSPSAALTCLHTAALSSIVTAAKFRSASCWTFCAAVLVFTISQIFLWVLNQDGREVAWSIWWGKLSKKHNYKYMAKWWCLLAMEKTALPAYGGHLQVLTTSLLKELYIIWLSRVVMLWSHHRFTWFVKLSLVGCLFGQWIVGSWCGS